MNDHVGPFLLSSFFNVLFRQAKVVYVLVEYLELHGSLSKNIRRRMIVRKSEE